MVIKGLSKSYTHCFDKTIIGPSFYFPYSYFATVCSKSVHKLGPNLCRVLFEHYFLILNKFLLLELRYCVLRYVKVCFVNVN